MGPARPEALTRVIADCLAGRTDLERMARLGPSFAAGFSPARMVAEYREFYEEIAGRVSKN